MKIAELLESKQVGILYHFTDIHSAWSILESGLLKIGDKEGSFTAVGGGYAMTQPRTAISLTRNPHLAKTAAIGGNNEQRSILLRRAVQPWAEIRIVLDGDKLAHRNRIEPYVDSVHGISRTDNQAEERIRKDEVNIAGCVIRVDFNYRVYLKGETDWGSWASPPTDPGEKQKHLAMARDQAAMFVREIKKLGYNVVVY